MLFCAVASPSAHHSGAGQAQLRGALQDFSQRFLQAGHSQDFVAKEIGAKVRQIIQSEDYQRVFSDVHIKHDMRAMDYWALTNGRGKYVGKGAGQGISGFRGNYGMVDDPYKSRKDAESATIRDSVFKWYSDDFSTRLLPGSPLGIIMTRWHSDDLCGRITDREEKEQRETKAGEQREFSGQPDRAAHLSFGPGADRMADA